MVACITSSTPASRLQRDYQMPVLAFGNWLRELREEADLTGAEVAEQLGVSHAAIYQWEGGHCLPSLDGPIERKYARLLKIKVGDFRQRHKEARLGVKRIKREREFQNVMVSQY
jgi:DNA-binding XRE family transcriptional regulator